MRVLVSGTGSSAEGMGLWSQRQFSSQLAQKPPALRSLLHDVPPSRSLQRDREFSGASSPLWGWLQFGAAAALCMRRIRSKRSPTLWLLNSGSYQPLPATEGAEGDRKEACCQELSHFTGRDWTTLKSWKTISSGQRTLLALKTNKQYRSNTEKNTRTHKQV